LSFRYINFAEESFDAVTGNYVCRNIAGQDGQQLFPE